MDRNYRKEIRRANVRRLVELLTLAEVCRLTGMKRQQLAQYIQRVPTRSIGDKVAQRIEQSLKLPDGFIDLEQPPSRMEEILRGAALLQEDDAVKLVVQLKTLSTELATKTSTDIASLFENKLSAIVAQEFRSYAHELLRAYLEGYAERLETSRLESFKILKAYFSDIREGQDVINTKLDLVLQKYKRDNLNGNNGNGNGEKMKAKKVARDKSDSEGTHDDGKLNRNNLRRVAT